MDIESAALSLVYAAGWARGLHTYWIKAPT